MTKPKSKSDDDEDRKPGRPNFVPTKEQKKLVESMVVAQLTRAQMAKILGIDRKTFRKAFREEIKLSMARVNQNVVARLFAHTEKSVPAAIFWLCNRDPQNWSNAHMLKHAGNQGQELRPIIVQMNANDKAL